jgi:hypothetical protein
MRSSLFPYALKLYAEAITLATFAPIAIVVARPVPGLDFPALTGIGLKHMADRE